LYESKDEREREGKKPGDDKCGRKKRLYIDMYELKLLVEFRKYLFDMSYDLNRNIKKYFVSFLTKAFSSLRV